MKTTKPTADKSDKKQSDPKSSPKIQSDFPLSEKDEVKNAEHNLQKGQKKSS
jgi:hypothetical protein